MIPNQVGIVASGKVESSSEPRKVLAFCRHRAGSETNHWNISVLRSDRPQTAAVVVWEQDSDFSVFVSQSEQDARPKLLSHITQKLSCASEDVTLVCLQDPFRNC